MKQAILILIFNFITLAITCTASNSSPTPEPTAMSALIRSPSPTSTTIPSPTPSLTATASPIATPTPSPTVVTTATLTLPCTPSSTPPTDCPVPPTGSFLTIWQSDPELQTALGCPASYHPRVTPAAWQVKTSYQPFEHGEMIWSDHMGWYAQPVVYVLYADSTYQGFNDTFDPAADPIGGSETPPNGLVEPLYGFGKVWRDQPGVREALGWATESETPGVGHFQMFTGGNMVWISQTNQTYVLVFHCGINTVRVFDVPFSEE